MNRVLSVLWQLVKGLIALLVILAMFHAANAKFETIVISALTLVYISVNESFTWLIRIMAEDTQVRGTQFIELARMLNHPDVEGFRTGVQDLAERLKRTQTKFWIGMGFTSVIFLIAIWNLIGAIA